MTTPLRAFLLVRAPPGEWDVSVHHDLEVLVRAWGAASAAVPGASAIVHVGFERAPTSVFEEVASAHPGRVLLTQGGRYALPGTFLSSSYEVGEGKAGPLYLGLRGWGYELAEAQLPRRQRAPQPFADWLVNYAAEHPDEAESLQMAGVVDEATYLSGEGGLPWALRRKMGTFRFRALIEGQNADPCAVALCAPPWMLSRGVASTEVSVRVFNVFSACGISTVEDLSRASVSELLRLPNFGKKSVTDILRWLDHTLNAGPPTDELENVAAAGPDLLSAIRRTLMSYGARERDILARRMGLDGLPETLAEIGLSFGITRERVRQIEARALEKLILEETWDDVLRDKLSLILKDRSFPLPLLGVEVVDSWFSGVSENTHVFRYVAANICRGEVGLITVDGIEYVGFIDQARWDLAVSEARKLLEGGAGRGWTRSRCDSLVAAMLPAYAGEFSTLLWDRATRFCHFSADGQGEDILQTYGRGAEQVVQAILQESPSPLHYSEIADLAGRRGRGILDPRRAHNAAASVGFLLGRGTYGLAKHLSLGVEDMATVADEAAEMIASGDAGRQWHSSEILSLLAEQGSVPAQRANRYEIDVALRLADDLDSHGRMIWSRRAASGTDAARIDLRQAVLAILEKAGRPLKTADIRQRLVALRGVGQNFQIVAQDPLLRVGPGRWGLNDRDFVVKRSDQKALVVKLLDALTRDGKGIHASELWSFVPRVDLLTTEEVFSIAGLDPRLHVGPGQYLFLSEWGSSRRVTVSESVSLVLNEAVGALTLSEIIARVQVHLGRSCDRPSVSACLQALDAELSEDGRWRLGQTEPEADSVEFPSRE